MKVFFIFLIFSLNLIKTECISCRNEITGQPVDWFTLYKLPKFKQTSNLTTSVPFIEYGTAYTFLTNESIEWQLSSLNINDTRSFPGKTLDVLYNENVGYMLYNDQADKVTLIKGHTKGVILFDNTSAVWISHSIPHFPPPKIAQKYYIQPSQCVYGQSMFCMSLELEELDNIGQQLLYNNPQVYDSFIPDYLKDLKVLENLVRVIKEDYSSVVAPWYNLNAFRTANGEELLSFAKFTYFGDDLYSGIVASYLQSNLLTETWNNGAGTLSSNCSIKFQVHNIEEVKFETIGIHFSVHSDHSKWAVTTGEKYRITCIGDINRQDEQFRRAGGTVCFLKNEKVWNQYFKNVVQIQPC